MTTVFKVLHVKHLPLAALYPLLVAAFPTDITLAADAKAAEREAVVAHYKAHNDPVIEDAAWSSATLFNVGVHYMGSDETAQAEKVCELLKEHDLNQRTRVCVIDINTMGADQKRWEVVGEARC
jgi:Tat protein secretion system quality control protein TatD with DNase activity